MDASLVTTGAITFTGEAKYKCADGYAMESLLTDATHVSPEGAVSEFSRTHPPQPSTEQRDERGQNRDPQKIEWSLYSVKKCLTDAIWSLEVSY